MKNLKKIIKNNTAKIAIFGMGYVGIPLARTFTNAGFEVTGIDIDSSRVKTLKLGISPISHITDIDIAHMLNNGFAATDDYSIIKKMDVLILCVPTPLSKNREPDLSYIIDAANNAGSFMRHDQLIILESTTFPGTTDRQLLDAIESSSGLKNDKDFWLAFSPEREDPGNKKFTTQNIPKVVGSSSKDGAVLAESLYKKAFEIVITVNDAKTAEAVKITENIFRSVNIALVNELKVVFDAMDIDVWDVIDAAATKPFGFMPFYPGPGLGGHCIPIDPFYLSYKAKEFDVPTRFIELAGEINTKMPNYVVEKIIYALSESSKLSINGSNILIIGLSYKKDIDDMRESPSIKIIEQLNKLGSQVSFHDSYIKDVSSYSICNQLHHDKSIDLTKENIEKYDAIVISTNHSNIDYCLIASSAKVIIDTRNAMNNTPVSGYIIKA